MGMKIGGDAAKSGKNTHLLVIIRVGLLPKNWSAQLDKSKLFQKGNVYKIRTKIVVISGECV